MVNTCINYNLNLWHVVNFFHILSFVMSGIFQVRFGAEFWPHSHCKNDQYFPPKWLKIPNLKFLSESEPNSSNSCSRPCYPQIMKVIPKLFITSNSSLLYFLYGARSYAEEFNHLKLQLCRTENSQFHKNVADFPNFMDPGPRSKYPEKSLDVFLCQTGADEQANFLFLPNVHLR